MRSPAGCPWLVCPSTAEVTGAAGWPQPSPWSSSQAAMPTGESARPYSVCGRVPIIGGVAAPPGIQDGQLLVGALFVG